MLRARKKSDVLRSYHTVIDLHILGRQEEGSDEREFRIRKKKMHNGRYGSTERGERKFSGKGPRKGLQDEGRPHENKDMK